MLYDKKHIYLRAPMRISFVGGGTDIATYYNQGKTGHVVSAAIDLYSYVTLKDMFDSNTRVHHAEIETESITSRIRHNYARIALEYFGLFRGVEVVLTSDVMTTGSGLGASSSMMSSLILGCNEIKNQYSFTKYDLAELTYKLEQDAGTVGGKQDQYAAVFGGLNSITFETDKVSVTPVVISEERLKQFEDRVFLVFTNLARESRMIQLSLTSETNSKEKQNNFNKLCQLSHYFLNELQSESTEISKIGEILHDGWMLKKSTNSSSTNPYIEQLYDSLRSKGVVGGKILGAGGGGFFLAFAREPEMKEKIKYDLYPNFIAQDVRFTFTGTEILWKNF